MHSKAKTSRMPGKGVRAKAAKSFGGDADCVKWSNAASLLSGYRPPSDTREVERLHKFFIPSREAWPSPRCLHRFEIRQHF